MTRSAINLFPRSRRALAAVLVMAITAAAGIVATPEAAAKASEPLFGTKEIRKKNL